jgi:hypothetical protein
VAAGVLPGDAPLRQAVLDVFTQRGMGGDARSDGAWYRSVKEGGGAIGTDYRKDCK